MSDGTKKSPLPPNVRLLGEIELIDRLWRSLMDEHLRALGVTQAGWITLWYISDSDEPMNQTELAKKVGVENSTMVRQLDVLEAAGLIQRVTITDRRVRLVKLTDAGQPVIDRVKQIADELSRELFVGVAREDLERSSRMLRQTRQRLQNVQTPQ